MQSHSLFREAKRASFSVFLAKEHEQAALNEGESEYLTIFLNIKPFQISPPENGPGGFSLESSCMRLIIQDVFVLIEGSKSQGFAVKVDRTF
jgi:hypothetical protein